MVCTIYDITSPKVINTWVGHASVSTTYDIYAHVIPELETEAIKKVAEKLLAILTCPPKTGPGVMLDLG